MINCRVLLLTGFAAVSLAGASQADVRLPRIFSNDMVLQRDKQAAIWGWADPGEKISVSFGGQSISCVADTSGDWSVKLAPMKANANPQDLNISGKNQIKLTNILVGDVWMVSGQSNAAFSLGGCSAPEDVASANFPQIRFSGYWELFTGSPQKDGGAKWNVTSPGSAAGCSAIGFYFARKVFKETGIPIGILTCAVGGTEIENWMSPEAINDYPGNAEVAKAYRERIAQWEEEMATPKQVGPADHRPAYLPSDQMIGFDPATEWCGKVRDALKASDTPLDKSFVELENWIKAAKAAVAEKKSTPPMPDFGPVGEWLLSSSLPDNLKRIPLAPHPNNDRWQYYGHGWFRTQSLYNGMVAPMLPFTIKGMLWYQGEGGSGTQYYSRLQSMIEVLRKKKQDNFSAYVVQLPNYGEANDEPDGGKDVNNWPITREQQLKCLQMSNTGLAVTVDVGDPKDLHPKNKYDMGERLALWALAKDYGKKIVFSGPIFKSIQIGSGKVRISFDNTGSGLMVGRKDGRNPVVSDKGAKLKRFAIAGEDKKWFWADAVIDGKTVVVSSPQVPKPVAVRYAFSMNPEGCNLYNKEGLPASPFRTDEW